MFKSIEYNNSLEIKITDSEFTAIVVNNEVSYIVESIIECYESRKLNVAYNLFLFHLTRSNYIDLIINDIRFYATYVVVYQKYVDDLYKYVDRYKKLKGFY